MVKPAMNGTIRLSRVAEFFLLGAVFLLPYSYAMKSIIGYPDIKWIDPSLICGLVALMAVCLSGRLPFRMAVTVGFGFLFMAWIWVSEFYVALADGSSVSYAILREPIRFSLNFLLFLLVRHYARDPLLREKLVRVLMWTVIIQMCIAIYFWLAFWFPLPLPETTRFYVRYFAMRQAWWFHGSPLPRLGGTFIEGPPLGQFAIGCLITFLHLSSRPASSRLKIAGLVASGLIVLGTFSSQVFLGMISWLFGYLVINIHRRASRLLLAGFGAILVLSPLLVWQLASRAVVDQERQNVRGATIHERLWHMEYGWGLVGKDTQTALIGVGLGRYGEHAATTGIFPPTVVPQVMVMDILTGTGVIGLLLWLSWIFQIFTTAVRNHGPLGFFLTLTVLISMMFQANWNWGIAYVVLGLLVAGPILKEAQAT